MDTAIANIVHGSFVCVFLEIAYRKAAPTAHGGILGSYTDVQATDINADYWAEAGYIFFYSYLLCLMTQLFGFKDMKTITTSTLFRSTLSFLHGLDGFAALLIGASMYYRSRIGLWIGSIMITKVFLIHLLNRLILAKKSDLGIFAECTQTTKSYLHHVSSFFFLSHPSEIIITTLWRTISMTGHATLVLRGKVSPSNISKINWILAYMRILMVIAVLYFCFVNDEIASAFGRSAVGHISYMMVRAGPVYQTGSMYLNEKEKEHWASCSDGQKMYHLITGKYFMLSVELMLLLFTSLVFFSLKIASLLI